MKSEIKNHEHDRTTIRSRSIIIVHTPITTVPRNLLKHHLLPGVMVLAVYVVYVICSLFGVPVFCGGSESSCCLCGIYERKCRSPWVIVCPRGRSPPAIGPTWTVPSFTLLIPNSPVGSSGRSTLFSVLGLQTKNVWVFVVYLYSVLVLSILAIVSIFIVYFVNSHYNLSLHFMVNIVYSIKVVFLAFSPV